MDDILVSIRCITYNHAPYIRQCLDGFVMQKTNFCFSTGCLVELPVMTR